MSVKLQANMTQNAQDMRICEDYWAYLSKDGYDGYIKHLQAIRDQYEISSQVLCATVAQCFAYLDDVLCEYCGYICPLEVPADIPYMRAKNSWCCDICQHALWREQSNR